MTNIYTFKGHDLRTIELDGEPWFVASDVCRCLGLKPSKAGYNNHTRRLGPDERKVQSVADQPHAQGRGLRARPQCVITESGLYKLIMRSDKDTARPFQDWVTKEVLPSIRKTGGYLLNEAARDAIIHNLEFNSFREINRVGYLSPRPGNLLIKQRNPNYAQELRNVDMPRIYDAIIDAEPTQNWWEFKMLTYVLADTGFRMGEALQLGPSSINRQRWIDPVTGQELEGTFLMLNRYTTKNDKPRQVPVTDRLLRLIPTLNARAKAGRWFPWQPGSNTPLRYLGFIKQDVKARGYSIDNVTLHTWRHTCATRLAQGGMDLIALRDWLGHGDIKITAGRYIHLMVGHIHRGTAILDTFNGTRGSAPRLEAVASETFTTTDGQSNGNYRATLAR